MRVLDSHPIPPQPRARLESLSKRHALPPYRLIYISGFRPLPCQHTLRRAHAPCRPAATSGLSFRLSCSLPAGNFSQVSPGFPRDRLVLSLHNAKMKAMPPNRQINKLWPFLWPPYIFWPRYRSRSWQWFLLVSLDIADVTCCSWARIFIPYSCFSPSFTPSLSSALCIYPTWAFSPADPPRTPPPPSLLLLFAPEPASSAGFPRSIPVACFSPSETRRLFSTSGLDLRKPTTTLPAPPRSECQWVKASLLFSPLPCTFLL